MGPRPLEGPQNLELEMGENKEAALLKRVATLTEENEKLKAANLVLQKRLEAFSDKHIELQSNFLSFLAEVDLVEEDLNAMQAILDGEDAEDEFEDGEDYELAEDDDESDELAEAPAAPAGEVQ